MWHCELSDTTPASLTCLAGLRRRQGSEWHKYRTEFGKRLASQTEVNRLVGPINDVTDDFVSRLRHVRDRDGDLAVVNQLTKDVHNWSMEGDRRLNDPLCPHGRF